ncbi:MAG: hypothetical protein ACI4WW_07745 [Candidatus Coprovivens sp.]
MKNKLKKIKKNIINYVKNLKSYELILLLLIPIIFLCCYGWHITADIWYMFRMSDYILNNGFPHYDVLSMHTMNKCVVPQWLYGISIWLIFKSFKGVGLYIFTWITIIILGFCLYKLNMIVSDKNRRLSIIMTSVILFLLSNSHFLPLRPQVISYILIVCVLIVYESYYKNGNAKVLLFLPLISILQMNIHASLWWFIIIYSLPFLAEQFINQVVLKKKNKCDIRIMILFFLGSFMVGIINPYGVDGINYFINSSYNKYVSLMVSEMHVFSSLTKYAVYIFIIIAIYIAYLSLAKKRRFRIAHFFIIIGSLFISFTAIKSVAFFLLTAIYPLSYCFSKNVKIIKEDRFKDRKLIYKICYCSIVVLSMIFCGYYISKRNIYTDKIDYYSELMELKDKVNQDNVTLYINYNNGSYAEYLGFKPFIDTRAEAFYMSINENDEIFNYYYLVQHGEYDINEFVEKFNFTHIFLTKDDYIYDRFDNDNYHLIMEGESYKVYERNDYDQFE